MNPKIDDIVSKIEAEAIKRWGNEFTITIDLWTDATYMVEALHGDSGTANGERLFWDCDKYMYERHVILSTLRKNILLREELILGVD